MTGFGQRHPLVRKAVIVYVLKDGPLTVGEIDDAILALSEDQVVEAVQLCAPVVAAMEAEA